MIKFESLYKTPKTSYKKKRELFQLKNHNLLIYNDNLYKLFGGG
ncbi:hypothetical protein TMP139_950007 [Tenacibaculum maritimum]|nr:hypothetical protein TMP139_950007 [Tenacibaculum maritimum]